MFKVCVFHRLKGRFCELIKHNRKVPFWKIPGTFGTIPVKTGNLLRSEFCEIWCPAGPKVSTMAVMEPSMVEGRLFRSWYRYMKKSETCFTEGVEKSTEFSLHHFSNRAHFDL